jgi:hypothetical protein
MQLVSCSSVNPRAEEIKAGLTIYGGPDLLPVFVRLGVVKWPDRCGWRYRY